MNMYFEYLDEEKTDYYQDNTWFPLYDGHYTQEGRPVFQLEGDNYVSIEWTGMLETDE